ncbi:MAG: hypothetical protein ACXVCY_16355 [Pseudobdellovibrionaceae bacterium]
MKLENYRHYLQSEFEKRRVRNPNYSLRAYARDLQTSPSRLSEALNSKRGISSKLAQQMIVGLELEGIDAEIFLFSVEAEHSRSEKQRVAAKTKLKEVLSSTSEIPPKTFTVVDWVADAILKMSERDAVVDNVQETAMKLDVPQFMVIEALRFLTRLGFITGTKKFRTYLQNRGRGRRLNVDYIQVLERAQNAYSSSFSDNFFQHEVFLLEQKDLEKARRILQTALANIRQLEKKTKNSKVTFVANQIFSVEKKGK